MEYTSVFYQEYLAVNYLHIGKLCIHGEFRQNNHYLLITLNLFILGKNAFTLNMAKSGRIIITCYLL